MNSLLDVAAALAGVALVVVAILSAMRVLVVPRTSRDRSARIVFVGLRRLFDLWALRLSTYKQVDRLMAWFAPTALLVLVTVWLVMVLVGYTGIFLLVTGDDLHDSFMLSGSSLLTLGFASPGEETGATTVALSEAAIGLILIALLIAYLPTLYAAFSRRETLVGMLEVRAGSPPSAIELLARYQRLQWLPIEVRSPARGSCRRSACGDEAVGADVLRHRTHHVIPSSRGGGWRQRWGGEESLHLPNSQEAALWNVLRLRASRTQLTLY